MNSHQEIILKRDCDAIQIPSGTVLILPAGTQVIVTQSLGGTFTVATPGGLARIDEKDADALGLEVTVPTVPVKTAPEGTLEEAVWNQLKTVFDPEIPVNVVDLGLIYDCAIITQETGGTRLPSKLADADEVQEVGGAQKLSVQELLDASGADISSTSSRDAVEIDEARRTKDFDAGLYASSCPNQNSSPTQHSSSLPQVAVDGDETIRSNTDATKQFAAEVELGKKSTKAHVKMTLTAPGCGMGPTIAADARAKILTIDGIDEAEVELVWDPAWNQSMISEAGRMKLGMV
ncbi:MAG TPA: iron-sulfur cluster assembly protein [Chthoniobacterales bacterium]|nr:iron-sulfur cluster assembly protein [Chthoniobacterales bacterium]